MSMYFAKGGVRMKRYYILHIFEFDYTKSIVCENIEALCKAIYKNKSLYEQDFYIESKWLSCDLIKKLGYFIWSDKDE